MPISTKHTHTKIPIRSHRIPNIKAYLPTKLYPNECTGAILGHRLHFTQILNEEKVNKDIGLSNGFHITIHFETGFESISHNRARGTCIERLHKMDMTLGTCYFNPINVGSNVVT